MSQPRFAPITASLLARKGNAMPSAMAAMPPVPSLERTALKPAVASAEEPEVAHDAVPHDPSRPKKLFVALSHGEHERLAIAAVKTGLSRHEIVRDALEMYFEQLSADMGEDCACITGGFASPSGCCRS